ncbi:MAG: DegT/DnrJ/EryC1/StrS family aminotransferase [Betaproteobacteria bacterium]|nr:DegT/DnrJ/EryC1/StrS family aminotransferase [Betaproteobacteria bacterium]
MTTSRYPLSTTTWGHEEIEAAIEVLKSGRTTMSTRVRAFEEQFANFVGSRYAVMVNSGSSANLLMIAALSHRRTRPLRPGDEVIVPAVSWPTTYYPLHQYGLRLVFVDINLDTLNLDTTGVRNAITPRTRAVFGVNLLGNPLDFRPLLDALKGSDIYLLEDNCESLGAKYDGKQTGTFGTAGTFSFFFSHHMSTMEGGMVVTDDEELYHFMLSIRAHGWTRDLPDNNLVCGRKSADAFAESFRFVIPGYNLRPMEINAAIGLCQLKKLPDFIATRRRNALHFKQLFDGDPHLRIQMETGESSWFGFSMIIRDPARNSRAALIRLLQRAGVECRPIVAGNFAKNEVVKLFNSTTSGPLRNAEFLDEHGFFVGNHHYDIRSSLDLLHKVLNG